MQLPDFNHYKTTVINTVQNWQMNKQINQACRHRNRTTSISEVFQQGNKAIQKKLKNFLIYGAEKSGKNKTHSSYVTEMIPYTIWRNQFLNKFLKIY